MWNLFLFSPDLVLCAKHEHLNGSGLVFSAITTSLERKPPIGKTAPYDMCGSAPQHLPHQWEQHEIDQAADLHHTFLPLLLGGKAIFRVGIVVGVRIHVGGPIQGMRHVVEEENARCLDANGCDSGDMRHMRQGCRRMFHAAEGKRDGQGIVPTGEGRWIGGVGLQ